MSIPIAAADHVSGSGVILEIFHRALQPVIKQNNVLKWQVGVDS